MSPQPVYYDDVQVGDAIPSLVKNPTTRQLVKYAGASGDYYEVDIILNSETRNTYEG